ncbi:MAG: HPr family phosphocarrier protein [Lachnospiraceae bacterium]|nr:HPr family phosphocarrier protein [Lachnospiraceae bacterium]
MLRKKIQVSTSGGIHMAIAVSLGLTAKEQGGHVFLKTDKKMVSAKEVPKVLALGVHELDWVEVIVDSEGEEEALMERIERILCNKW